MAKNWKEMTLIELKAEGVRFLQAACKDAGIKSGVQIDDMAQRLFGYTDYNVTGGDKDADKVVIEEIVEPVPDTAKRIEHDGYTEPVTKPDPQLLTSPLETESQIGKKCCMAGCDGIVQADGASRIKCNGKRRHGFDI